MRTCSTLCLMAISLAACESAPAPVEDAAVASCGDPTARAPRARRCGAAPARASSPARTRPAGPVATTFYECVGGEWTFTIPGCVGGSPPLAESCRTPFDGALPGARLQLTADRAGAPELVDGDSVEIAFGAQGLAMVPFRIALGDVDETSAPSCVRVTTTLTLEGVASAPSVQQVRLRCGSSLRVQEILPDLPCEERSYAIGVDVAVDGVGSLHLDLTAMGGLCPLGGMG
ncbi:MAG: hypothetical protein M5U28_20880 [Sandaracinaceae bacterium]|nr:hypothetical protein [Sandaracinaceae bacterium]